MKIFVFGSSIQSSYWNGAATYYRGIYKELSRLGYEITFAEPDALGRQQHLDPGDYSYVRSIVYASDADLSPLLEEAATADLVVKHSGVGVRDVELEARVPQCRRGHNAVAFWDVDAPATLARLDDDPDDPFHRDVPRFDAVITYGGGPRVIDGYLRRGANACIPIYNALHADTHFPVEATTEWRSDLTFLGNRLPDRERRVEDLFLAAATLAPEFHFILGGEGWEGKPLPPNVRWIGHVPTARHNSLNCSARMVLNINRESMAAMGFSPPTRVFEAAGSGACLLCDDWPGVEHFFIPGEELLVARTAEDIVAALRTHDEAAARRMGAAFRARALRDHTYAQRALEFDKVLREQLLGTANRRSSGAAFPGAATTKNAATSKDAATIKMAG